MAAVSVGEEWWDGLLCEEESPLELGCDSPRGAALQDWAWVDGDTDDCFGLAAVEFPDGGPARAAPPDLVSEGLGDALLPAVFPTASPSGSPRRLPFKASFAQSPEPAKDACTDSPASSTPDSSKSANSVGIVVDLAADEHSDTVTCHIARGQLRHCSSKDCSGGELAAVDGTAAAYGGVTAAGSKAQELPEHEGDSGSPGLPKEVELPQPKPERLGQASDQDSGAAAATTWPQPAGNAVGFIPVSNALPAAAASSDSTDAPSKSRAAGDEGADETEGTSDAEPVKKPRARRVRGDESPSDSRDSAQSNSSTAADAAPEEAKPRKLGRLTDAASASDVTVAGLVGRKRPGRPAKPTPAAAEAKAKRKRATTSKPAAPAVNGQACTQCFTHVTPVWRAGPEGPKTLCNACGVRYMKVAKRK